MLCIKVLKFSKLFKCNKWSNVALRLSTQPAVKSTEEDYNKQLKDFDTLTSTIKKIRPKKPQKPPFAKNLLLGVFDTDILAYPELQNDDINNLESTVKLAEKLLKQEHMVKCDSLNKTFRQNLADYKLIGLQAPQLMDGRECYVSETNRFLEILASHKLRDSIIHNEQCGIQILMKFGSEQLKKKFLHKVMKGDYLSAVCIAEKELSEDNLIKTKATLSQDEKTWILNGQKTWVVNGLTADFYIVVALTNVIERDVIKQPRLSVFLVEKDSPGVSCTEIKTYGTEMATVSFTDTPVPNDNLIGEVDQGEGVITSILPEFRLSCAPACITITKKILNELAASILEQSNSLNLLHETDAVKGKIGEMTSNLYAMESVLYLTTGLLDTYENQDCELESILTKIFCSQTCVNSSITALDLVGMPALCESHWANQLHRDAIKYIALHDTNDSLKVMGALIGLQFAGVKLRDKIEKMRNPLFHGVFTLKQMWVNRRNSDDNPKLDLLLGEYLHPSLYQAAQLLEYSVKRLEFATEILLAKFGPEVISQHIDLRRLGDCIIDVYAMTAVLGRASRSYCIGLQFADQEIYTANTFCAQATERVRALVQRIHMGEIATNDEHYRILSQRLFQSKGYFMKHPLSRNF